MIKAKPEDFIVEERAELPLVPSGPFRAYLLRKRGWTTPDLVRRLAREAGLPARRIAYGGKKDKHGSTTQFLTVEDGRDLSRAGEDFDLEAVGFMDRPMGPDLILGNRFSVTVRGLADPKGIEEALEDAVRRGVPNWFDDQRFRSYDPERGFFADKILRRQWNGALQSYLTSVAVDLPGREKERRRELFHAWRDWTACRALAVRDIERRVFEGLIERPSDFGPALRRIPQEEVSMQYAAFQGHLWNELLRRVLRAAGVRLSEVPGREGPYLFWTDGDALPPGVEDLELPTAAAKMVFPDPAIESLFEAILSERGLSRSDFRTRELRRVSFKSFSRRARIVPEDLRILGRGPDELHPGRGKIALAFALPRGSYATILIKRLELQRRRP